MQIKCVCNKFFYLKMKCKLHKRLYNLNNDEILKFTEGDMHMVIDMADDAN